MNKSSKPKKKIVSAFVKAKHPVNIMIPDSRWREFLKNLRLGLTQEDSCILSRISDSTVRRMVEISEAFRGARDEAMLHGKQQSLRVIHRAQISDWKAGGWYLERKYAKEFGSKNHLELTGEDGKPIKTQDVNFGDMTAKDLMKISELLTNEPKRDTTESRPTQEPKTPN